MLSVRIVKRTAPVRPNGSNPADIASVEIVDAVLCIACAYTDKQCSCRIPGGKCKKKTLDKVNAECGSLDQFVYFFQYKREGRRYMCCGQVQVTSLSLVIAKRLVKHLRLFTDVS